MAVREMECGLAGSLRARVQRGESPTARCASKGNCQASLFLFPSFYLGQYIITVTPTKHTIAPMTSNRSGST